VAATVLVTGAAGFIGSHCALALLEAGFAVVALDNLVNGSRAALARVERLAGRALVWVEGDVRDTALLGAMMARHRPEAVVHLAGLKSVAESAARPLDYYDANVVGSLRLLEASARGGASRFVFSSSATVYDAAVAPPYREDSPLSPANPYGDTKLAMERMIEALAAAEPDFRFAVLRYFNPAGAHASGEIGEEPRGVPNNLMPLVARAALDGGAPLAVFGGDWPTPDGSGVRDYVHVMDLAEAHVLALQRLLEGGASFTVNLGAARGHSVYEVIRAFERASGRPIAHRLAPRRPGDVAASWADSSLAQRLLGWRAARDLDSMCRDAWRWRSRHPRGYEGE
jgi:UDP-glucose 4-epimerase